MLERAALPSIVQATVEKETVLFAVKARRKKKVGSAVAHIVVVLIFTCVPLGLLLIGGGVASEQITHDGTEWVIDFGPEIWISAGVLLLIGLWLLAAVWGIIRMILEAFRSGSYFVGTESRLVEYDGKTVTSTDWKLFISTVETTGSQERGTVSLRAKSGYVDDDGGHTFRPHLMIDVDQPLAIAAICRARIG